MPFFKNAKNLLQNPNLSKYKFLFFLRFLDFKWHTRHLFFLLLQWAHQSSIKYREGGDIGLFITLVPKVYNSAFLFVGLTTLGACIEFWLVGSWSLIVQTFLQQLIVIWRRGNFVLHKWGCNCTLTYRPLSYPFRYLLTKYHDKV